jgi:hypothetical protein
MCNLCKNKVLFLWLNEKEFHAKQALERGVETKNIFRSTSRIFKVIRRLYLRIPFLPINIWLNASWVIKIYDYKSVIIHASILTPSVVRFIKKINPDIRVIVWYWNPINKSVAIKNFEKFDCEIWTFDEHDAKRYNIKHNTQYYFSNVKNYDVNSTEEGVLFVGGDKGRLRYLVDIKNNLISMGVEVNFNITNTSMVKISNPIYQPRINYDEVLIRISRCKAILDVVSENQFGLTLRPLESIFFRKKLITNDKGIIHRDFYNKSNIHILGVDDFSKIEDFISSPYIDLSIDIINKYDFNSWLARFDNV